MFFLQAEDMQQQIIRETFHLVSKRDDNVCNFLEGGRQVLLFAVILSLNNKHVFNITCTCTSEKSAFFVSSERC